MVLGACGSATHGVRSEGELCTNLEQTPVVTRCGERALGVMAGNPERCMRTGVHMESHMAQCGGVEVVRKSATHVTARATTAVVCMQPQLPTYVCMQLCAISVLAFLCRRVRTWDMQSRHLTGIAG
jgi:hypothetical protein